MDLSTPLASLLRGLDAVALRVIARAGAELTGRQVARLAATGTPANVRLALLRLVDLGLVLSAPAPHATMYSANRAHILWPAVEIAMHARQELSRRIREFSGSHAPDGVTVALYGSVARGDSTQTSDIDLLVVFPDTIVIDERDEFITELRNQVQLWTGNDTQIYDVTRSALGQHQKQGDPIVKNWLADGIIIYGNDMLGMPRAL